MMRTSKLILLAVFVMFYGPAVVGQTSTGGVNGTITDPSGASVPGALVRLTNQSTGIETHANTNENGYFAFVNVMPGTYSMKVEGQGFKLAQTAPFDIGVNQTLTQNVALAVGELSQTVDVSTTAEMLQASSSELGTVIEQKAVEELPLNGRNFTQLLSLTPGATPVNTAQGGGVSFQDAGPSGIPGSSIIKPSLNGQQNRSTLYFMDGIINTDLRGPIYGILPIVDLIQEFKVQSHNDKAEFGGVTGGIINVVSKSGGNGYHGSAYEFVRNDAFDARNSFSEATRTSPAVFRQNQFGATFGGPIIKNRTFFYGGYEGWRYIKPTQTISLVPTAAELGGDFTHSVISNQIYNPYSTRRNAANQFIRDAFKCDAAGNPITPLANGTQVGGTDCNRIPAALISPAMQGFLKTYLAAPNFNSGSQNYIENRPVRDNANSWQIKVDHRFGDKDNLFFRFSQIRVFHVDQVDGTNGSKPSRYHGNNWGGGWIHMFSPNLILDVRGGVLTKPYVFNQAESSAGISPLSSLGFANTDKYAGLVTTLAAPYITTEIGNRGDSIRKNPDGSVTANLNWIKGNHNLRTGYQYIWVERDQINTFQTFGYSSQITQNPLATGTTGNVLASALLGFPASSSAELPEGGEVHFKLATWSTYLQDEWKISPKLTLNLGIRWDVLTQPKVVGPRIANALDLFKQQWIIGASSGDIPACNQTNQNPCFPGNGLAGVPFSDHIVFAGKKAFHPPAVYDNFSPRIGIAWQYNSKTVVRAGYGLFYDALPARSQYIQNDLEAAQWPWVRAFSGAPNNSIGAPLVPITAVAGQLSAGPPTNPWTSLQSSFFDDPDYKDGRSQQWSFEVQRQLSPSTMFSVAYVGSVNSRLPYTGRANAAKTASPQGTATTTVDALRAIPWMTSSLNYTQSIGSGSYHALQAKLQRRLSKGLTGLVSYTWSKSIDNSSGYFGVENGAGQNGSSVQQYFEPNANRAVSGYDIPHFLSVYGLYELPFGKGKTWLKSGPAAWILGNWQVNSIFQIRSGQPFNLNVGGDPANISGSIGSVTGYARPNLIADPWTPGPVPTNSDNHCKYTVSQTIPTGQQFAGQKGWAADRVHSVATWFNPCALDIPKGSFGNFGRNSLRSSGVVNMDFSLFKKIKIGENKELQLRGEAFNVLNIVNWSFPSVTTIGQAGAGSITSMIGTPRQIQFGARFVF